MKKHHVCFVSRRITNYKDMCELHEEARIFVRKRYIKECETNNRGKTPRPLRISNSFFKRVHFYDCVYVSFSCNLI